MKAVIAALALVLLAAAPAGAYYDEWEPDPLLEAWEEQELTPQEMEELTKDPSIENPLAKKGDPNPNKVWDKVRVCDFGEQSVINFWIVSSFGKQLCQMQGGEIVWVTPEEDDFYKPMFWL